MAHPETQSEEQPSNWQSVLLTLSEGLWPSTPDFDAAHVEHYLIASLKRFSRLMPKFHFLFLRISCLLFEILPFFFGFGVTFFSQLPPPLRLCYFEKWLNSRVVLLRDVAKTLRSVAGVFYFSSPEVNRYIGYDAPSYVAERKALREALLKRTQP